MKKQKRKKEKKEIGHDLPIDYGVYKSDISYVARTYIVHIHRGWVCSFSEFSSEWNR